MLKRKNKILLFSIISLFSSACIREVRVYRRIITSDKGNYQTLWMLDKDSIVEYKVYRIACYPPVFLNDTIFNERHDIMDSVVFETEVRPQYKKNQPKWRTSTFYPNEFKSVTHKKDTDSIFFASFESIYASGYYRFYQQDSILCGKKMIDAYKFEFYRPEIRSLPQKGYLIDTISEYMYLDVKTFFPIKFDGEYTWLKSDSVFNMKRKHARSFFQNRKLNNKDTLNFIIKPDHLTRRGNSINEYNKY